MRFCVFTDLHYDVIPDGDRRLRELLEDCREKQVEFILELGDLCHPAEENKRVLEILRQSGIPCYFSLGNHNTDFCPPETALDFLGLERSWYSVVRENVKFVFLDANFLQTADGYLPECRENYSKATVVGPYIPPEQLHWLEQEIQDDRYYYIICTHQGLANDFVTKTKARGIVNRQEVRTILERRNQRSRRVLLCINGHEHGSDVKKIGGICYYTLNAASYFWQNVRDMYPYSPEIHQRFPYLKNMVLYREPLHCIVTIDEKSMTIEGMEGHYLTVSPEDIGMGNTWNGVSIAPRTESLTITK